MRAAIKNKIKVKLSHVNKKAPARNQISVQTPFSHSTLKLLKRKTRPRMDYEWIEQTIFKKKSDKK